MICSAEYLQNILDDYSKLTHGKRCHEYVLQLTKDQLRANLDKERILREERKANEKKKELEIKGAVKQRWIERLWGFGVGIIASLAASFLLYYVIGIG